MLQNHLLRVHSIILRSTAGSHTDTKTHTHTRASRSNFSTSFCIFTSILLNGTRDRVAYIEHSLYLIIASHNIATRLRSGPKVFCYFAIAGQQQQQHTNRCLVRSRDGTSFWGVTLMWVIPNWMDRGEITLEHECDCETILKTRRNTIFGFGRKFYIFHNLKRRI